MIHVQSSDYTMWSVFTRAHLVLLVYGFMTGIHESNISFCKTVKFCSLLRENIIKRKRYFNDNGKVIEISCM